MLMFASPVPSVFSGLDALQPRYAERPSTEEQYFQRLAEEHERAAALARKRLIEVRRQRQQEALEAQLRLQQELATALHLRTPQRPSYNAPTRRVLPSLADVILGFGADEARDLYAERMHQRTQEHQKRVEQQAMMRALFEEQRRAQAERVAELQRKRVLEAKAEQERQRKAQEEARRNLAARAADEEKIRQFFQALLGAVAEEGADLERKNAIRRNSAPAQEKPKDVPAPAPAPKSAPATPKAPERAASPAPSVASDASDASLNSIAHLQDKYDTLRSNFTFPTTLVFAPSTSSPNASPSLLYNPTNAPVHAYEHALTNLLTELDAVESFGDSHVRDVRRSLARSVEAELEALEARKRDAWRSQSVKVEVEAPVAAESTPVESAPAPVVESAPVESTPAAESTPAPESAPVDPVEFLATRLAVPTESEDDELKAVRENLLASLTTEAAPVSTEADKDEPVTESEPTANTATEPEATPVTETETTTIEPEPVTKTAPSETEPEVVDAHTPTAAPEIVVSTPEPVTVVPEPEVTLTSQVESVASSSEPEAVQHEVETTVVVQPESESSASPLPESAPALPESESTVAPAHSEPESPATQLEPEHSAFVKVYSDSDSDSDLASEFADRKSAGDEFELL